MIPVKEICAEPLTELGMPRVSDTVPVLIQSMLY